MRLSINDQLQPRPYFASFIHNNA